MRHLLVIILILCVLRCQAQLPDYYVYLVKGEASISRPGTKLVAIKQNQLVYKNDVIIFNKGTEITLVDKEASFFVINVTGTYKVNELIKKISKKANEGITAKYLELLFNELLDPSHDFEKFKKESIAGITAGVSRYQDCENRIFPINGLNTSNNLIIFRWHKTSSVSKYLLVIYDDQGKELFKKNTPDTLLSINFVDIVFKRPYKFFWRVTSEDGKCEGEIPIYFDLLTSENEKEQVERCIVGISSATLEMQLLQIDKLEKNAFFYVASGRFATLVEKYPNNSALKKSYVLFLLKYGFEKEAELVWK